MIAATEFKRSDPRSLLLGHQRELRRTVLVDGSRFTYKLRKFNRSNHGTCANQKPIVDSGERVEAGQVIADGPCTENGEMALGRNLLVAIMPWEGHNYEDAIILSQRLVQDDVLSSIHIEEHEVDARDTKLGPEEITRDIPNVSEEVLADLDEGAAVGGGMGVGGAVVVAGVTVVFAAGGEEGVLRGRDER